MKPTRRTRSASSLVCVLASLVAAPRASAQSSEPLVIGETVMLPSAVLGEVRRINIYKPPIYGDTTAPLPVLCMPDGGLAEDFLHVAGLVQIGAINGTMRPFLLVGIENTERRRDLTGPTRSECDRAIAPRVGGSAAFRTFIRTELMPWVTSHYPTTGETAIVGESLAGLFVVETFFLEPDLFDSYIAIDPSLWWNERSLVAQAPERLRARPDLRKTLFVASSSEPELAELASRLARVLTTSAPAGVAWQYQPMPDETHGTIYHPAALRAFRKLFPPKGK